MGKFTGFAILNMLRKKRWIWRRRFSRIVGLAGVLILGLLIQMVNAIETNAASNSYTPGQVFDTQPISAQILALNHWFRSAQPIEPIEIPKALHKIPEDLVTGYIAQTAVQQFGHILYAEADPDQLMVIGSYSGASGQRFETLHPDAGQALMRMIDAARLEGVWIIPTSGFRDLAWQRTLFQQEILQQGDPLEAAKAVAPPGYSEHHTGYAIDLADGRDFFLDFGETPAFRWLTQHAQDFGFELSFPPDNAQGVIYEPWHWRYVGSTAAKTLFASARSADPKP